MKNPREYLILGWQGIRESKRSFRGFVGDPKGIKTLKEKERKR